MHFVAVVNEALRNLARAPVRSSLTALGTIVGVGAIVATASIGAGARDRLEESLGKAEARVLYVAAAPSWKEQNGQSTKLRPSDRIQTTDYRALRTELAHATARSPFILLPRASIQANGKKINGVIEGIDVEGLSLSLRKIVYGTSLGQRDVINGARICVLTESTAHGLGMNDYPVGRIVSINGIAFTIVGIAEDAADPARPAGRDFHAFIPYTTLQQRVDRNAEMSLSIQAVDPSQLDLLEREVSDYFERHRGNRRAEFRINNTARLVDAYTAGSQTISRLLAALGGISLLVGGIGIMNIMLAGVIERRREIGTRMAIGTRNRDILLQFLVEAEVLSTLGGGIGIGAGAMAAWFITHVNDWPTKLTVFSLLGSFLCSASVGVIFGYYPAHQASRLQPVESLRSE